jgi:hypothetical protein
MAHLFSRCTRSVRLKKDANCKGRLRPRDKRTVLRRVRNQVRMKRVFLSWMPCYMCTCGSQHMLAQRRVNVHIRLRLSQLAIKIWRHIVQEFRHSSSPNIRFARHCSVDSSDHGQRLLNQKKLERILSQWKLVVEEDKILPDVKGFVRCL